MTGMKWMRWLLLISGILLVALGVSTLFTGGALLSLAMFICVAVMLSGLSEIGFYCTSDTRDRSGWVLAGGILSVLLGLWLLIGSGYAALAMAIPFVFAMWVLSAGIMRIVGSFQLKGDGASDWGWVLLLGILETLCGFMMVFQPIMTTMLSSILVAALFISHGVGNIMMFSGITRLKNLLKGRAGDA